MTIIIDGIEYWYRYYSRWVFTNFPRDMHPSRNYWEIWMIFRSLYRRQLMPYLVQYEENLSLKWLIPWLNHTANLLQKDWNFLMFLHGRIAEAKVILDLLWIVSTGVLQKLASIPNALFPLSSRYFQSTTKPRNLFEISKEGTRILIED